MKKRKKKERSESGMRLAARWRKGFFSVVFSRLGLVLIVLLFQLLFIYFAWDLFGELLGTYTVTVRTVLEIIVMMILINSKMDNAAKVSWMLVIAFAPLLGSVFYLWTQFETGHKNVKHKMQLLTKANYRVLPQNHDIKQNLKKESPESAALAEYLYRLDGNPVYDGTTVKYYSCGEEKFPDMLDELDKAEKFIFLEYFIIEEGYMWGKILEVLAKKAAEGVDVRVMYDGSCDLSTLPYNYPKRLAKIGIKCKKWEPIKPVITSTYNYRDHRKILVIDGKVGFCGGVNLADEYINHIVRFGYWKDTAIKLKGPAVDSFTLMFLQMWNITEKKLEDIRKYFGQCEKSAEPDGYIIPYSESPMNDHKIAERVYMDMLYNAKNYIWITSPYLILDGELSAALRYAAQRGVDVRLILPGIPDKKAVWALAKSHYKQLVTAGVKIYEFTPGFVHAKNFISDDCKAVVGTINLDYRSLYHHFECAAYMYGCSCIADIKKDFEATFPKCQEVTLETIKNEPLSRKIVGATLKMVAPML